LIHPEQLEAIRQATDIVDVVSGYVTLKQAGRNFVALCPFHREKTPSFNVNPERQIGGDVISFVMAIENITFPEAVRLLAERVGIQLEPSVAGDRTAQDRTRLTEALAFAADLYHQVLLQEPSGEEGRRYLTDRGIDRSWIQDWKVGFSPASRDFLFRRARQAGFSTAELDRAGLCYPGDAGRNPADRFTRRVMFPIHNTREQVVGFGGRAVTDEQRGKYINSSEGPLYSKSRLLFGLDRVNLARRQDPRLRQASLFVAEGYLDVMALHQAGLRTTVAPLGTALTEEQVRMLRPAGNPVVLLFDGDDAGADATRRAIGELVKQDVDARVARLPGGQDPFSLYHEEGAEALRARVNQAVPAYSFLIEDALRRHGDTVEGRAAAAGDLASVLGLTPNAVKEDGYIRQAAFDLRTSEAALRRLWADRKVRSRSSDGGGAPTVRRRLGRDRQAERDLALALIGHPTLVRRAVGEVPLRLLGDEQIRNVVGALYNMCEEIGCEQSHVNENSELLAIRLFDRLPDSGDPETRHLISDLMTEADRRLEWQREGRIDRYRNPFEDLYEGYLDHVRRTETVARRRELLEQMRNAMETHDDRSVSDHLEAISKLDRMRQSGGEERRPPGG
jgi:DNA primase